MNFARKNATPGNSFSPPASESAADQHLMPAIYENFGVRFLYPENWSVIDEEDDGWPQTVTVQSPQTSFWSLHVYPPNSELKPIVKELIAAIQEEFRDI